MPDKQEKLKCSCSIELSQFYLQDFYITRIANQSPFEQLVIGVVLPASVCCTNIIKQFHVMNVGKSSFAAKISLLFYPFRKFVHGVGIG